MNKLDRLIQEILPKMDSHPDEGIEVGAYASRSSACHAASRMNRRSGFGYVFFAEGSKVFGRRIGWTIPVVYTTPSLPRQQTVSRPSADDDFS